MRGEVDVLLIGMVKCVRGVVLNGEGSARVAGVLAGVVVGVVVVEAVVL